MSILGRLIEAGVASDIIEDVAMLLAEKKVAEAALEARRTKDRERQNRRRNQTETETVNSQGVTGCHVTQREKRDPSLSLPLPSPQTPLLTPTHTHPDNKPARVRGLPKPDGVASQTWRDFLELRKKKRAPVTQTVIDGIAAEAVKAGWALEQALAECVIRGWQGFKSDWVAEQIQRRQRETAEPAFTGPC